VNKKSLGQHFLHDTRVMRGIVSALELRDDEQIYEIGPGTGKLSRYLVEAAGHPRVTCLELDHRMVEHLAVKDPALRVIEGDAKAFDWSTVVTGPAVVCGNLPYNVSTVIYFHLLETHRARFRRMVLMFQKEVAQRLIAVPGSKRYGPPSVMTALLSDARMVMTVKPRSFKPPPRVDSAVIRVDPLPTPRFGVNEAEVGAVNTFVHTLFKHRRKTIANNLKLVAGAAAPELLTQAGIDPIARAEIVPPEALVNLWRVVLGKRP